MFTNKIIFIILLYIFSLKIINGVKKLSMSLEEIINKIRGKAKISKEDIVNRIKMKKSDLGGLITDEGAAYIIAKDLGVNILGDQAPVEHKLKISDLIAGMNSVSITGVVKDLSPVKLFDRGGGRKGAVASARIMDKSGEIRMVFWDDKTSCITQGAVKNGKVIRVIRGYVKEGRDGSPELNVGAKSEILYPTDTGLENLKINAQIILDLSDIKPNQSIPSVAGVVSRVTPPSNFIRSDGSEGSVMSLAIQGSKGSCRIVVWNDSIQLFEGIKEGIIIQIKNLYSRENKSGEIELHTTSNTEVIVNPELEIEFPKEYSSGPLPISDISGQIFDLDLLGEVVAIYDEKEFERADGTTGRVKSLMLRDNTGAIRVSLWDDKVKEASKLKIGDILKISHAYTRTGDFGVNANVGSKAIIEVNPPGASIPAPSEAGGRNISDIKDGMFNVSITGRVAQISGLKEFERADGSPGKVLSLILADSTGSIRVVAWNTSADKLLNLKTSDILSVKGGYTKTGLNNNIEVHLGELALIDINPPGIKMPAIDKLSKSFVSSGFERKKISELKPTEKAEVVGTIVYIFSKNIVYPACPNCFKKAEKSAEGWLCENCGPLNRINYRLIFSATIDDGSGTIRANLLGNSGENLLDMSAEQAQSLIESGKEGEINSRLQALVAKTYIFSGKVIYSDFSQDNELNVTSVRPLEAETEVKEILDYFKGKKKSNES